MCPTELDWQKNYGYGDSNRGITTSIAAAATLTAISGIMIITGTTALKTLTVPWVGFEGSVQLIFTDATPGTTLTTGNLAIASTPVTGKALEMTYSQLSGKWYPSY